MANLTGLDDIVNVLRGNTSGSKPQNIFAFIDPFINNTGTAATGPIAARVTSLWNYNGNPSNNNTIPTTTVVYPTNITTGSLGQQNAISASGELWLMGVTCNCLSQGTLLVYDRLAYMGGLSATVTTTQIVSESALTRYTGSMSVGNQIWVEIYTAIGGTSAFVMANYKNQNGVISTTPSASIGNTGLKEGQRMIQLPLASGDTGVTEVMSVNVSPSTVIAGNFGITIVRPLCWVPINIFGSVRDMVMDLPSITKIEANACIATAVLCVTTTAIQLMASFNIIEK